MFVLLFAAEEQKLEWENGNILCTWMWSLNPEREFISPIKSLQIEFDFTAKMEFS